NLKIPTIKISVQYTPELANQLHKNIQNVRNNFTQSETVDTTIKELLKKYKWDGNESNDESERVNNLKKSTLESECQIEILEDKEYIARKLKKSIKILENIKSYIEKSRNKTELEINNTIFNKIEHEDSCLSKKNKEKLHKSRNKQLADILLFEKLNKEIEYLQETKISKYKKHEKLKPNFLKDLKQELKNSFQKKLDFLKYKNEIEHNQIWTKETKRKFENYKNDIFKKLFKNDSRTLTNLVHKELRLIDHYLLYLERINRATNIKELNDLKLTEITLDPILKIKQSNALKKREISRRIREIVNLIYNKVLNETENITTLDQFIIGVLESGELTKNIYVLGENKDLLKTKRMNISTNKEDFKDNGKFDKEICILDNKYLKEKKTTDLQNIGKKKSDESEKPYKNIIITSERLEDKKKTYRGKAKTFNQQLDDLWGLVNDRDRQNNYIDDAYNIYKQIFETYKIKDAIPEKLLKALETLQTHAESTILVPPLNPKSLLLDDNL
ncbi:8598_t:CDS:2, partial [Gigaspora margarita]